MILYGYDSETHLTQPGLGAPPMVCGSISGPSGDHLLTPGESLRWLAERLPQPDFHIVGAATSYDLGIAAAADPTPLPLIFKALAEGRIHDVAIREALIDIAKGELQENGDDSGARYPLALLVARYFGQDISESKKNGWRKSYALLEGVPLERWPKEARDYALDDAVWARKVFEAQEGHYSAGGFNLHREAEEVAADFALRLASIWGFRCNADAVAALRAQVDADWKVALAELQAHGIFRADGTKDTKRVQQLVTDAYRGDPPYTPPSSKFPNGQIATDRDTLVESAEPILVKLGSTGKGDKYRTTYLPKLEAAVTAPFNPFFNILVATGRVSSDTQQLPQRGGVRECIEARPGYVFCSVDYGGLELRTMSQWAIDCLGYSLMAEYLNSGKDTHSHVAAQFIGTDYDTFKARIDAEDKTAKPYRDLGKLFNFGKGGGMGPAAIGFNARMGKSGETTVGPDGTVYGGTRFCILIGGAQRCGEVRVDARVQGKPRRLCRECVAIAKKLGEDWLRAWPEQGELFRRASQLSGQYPDGYTVETPRTGVVRGNCGYTQILNHPFQHIAAVGAKRATAAVSREMYADPGSALWGSRLVLMVHDELIAELPEDRAHEAGERMGYLMRENMKSLVPDLAASIEAEPALCRTMNKGMKTVRDESGRLRIWEPKPAK